MPCQEREGSEPVRRASWQAAASPVSPKGAPRGVRLLFLQPGTGTIQGLSAP